MKKKKIKTQDYLDIVDLSYLVHYQPAALLLRMEINDRVSGIKSLIIILIILIIWPSYFCCDVLIEIIIHI